MCLNLADLLIGIIGTYRETLGNRHGDVEEYNASLKLGGDGHWLRWVAQNVPHCHVLLVVACDCQAHTVPSKR